MSVTAATGRLIERVFHETGRGTNGAQTPGNKHGDAQNARESGVFRFERFLRDVRVLPTADSPADARLQHEHVWAVALDSLTPHYSLTLACNAHRGGGKLSRLGLHFKGLTFRE